jgi:hypothetical protein
MTDEQTRLALLQLVRVKGRVVPDVLATALAMNDQAVLGVLSALKADAVLAEVNGKYKITPTGREELERRLVAERTGVNQPALRLAYDRFYPLNSEFKGLVTDWQVRDCAPNLHQDAAYDAGIVQRLGDLDSRFAPLLAGLVGVACRLAHYPRRFQQALSKLRAGDSTWLAQPVLDSYHTVWFELHEDLIGLLGLNRAAEAAGGRAE